jgi:hypothetical protein
VAKLTFRYRPPPNLNGVSSDPGPRTEPPPALPVEEDPGSRQQQLDRWWHQSSYELRHGLEVQEDASDTVPGPLLDELFNKR